MHFAMHAFSSHVEVLNEVTPIEPVGQSAIQLKSAPTVYEILFQQPPRNAPAHNTFLRYGRIKLLTRNKQRCRK